jgi:hypothetical protein
MSLVDSVDGADLGDFGDDEVRGEHTRDLLGP